ncbi:ATP-binding protein [Metabacillus arenae]|uniref:histidine kinase n=1 Tax=Metabacillus arenae TaxID=2771434 RepID=A0A926NHX1_9BACI|nr:ATP-binding protein [Metabacillus arenae]MBD1381105.1 two-component sensor histidine kinase [Metabacillus arenae]
MLFSPEFLCNMLLALSPLLLVQFLYLYQEVNKESQVRDWVMSLVPAAAIILTMFFPISIEEEFFFDLRRVPYILGILYSGYSMNIFLFFLTVLVRIAMGGDGIIVTVISFGLLSLITPFFSKRYLKGSIKEKIAIVSLVMTASVFFSMIHIEFFYTSPYSMLFWTELLIMNLIVIILATVLFEIFLKNFQILKRVLKAEKLEVVSHLAASISHEVRNPLTSIKGFLQLMSDKSLSQEKREEYVKISLQELDRATQIINDYLTFAKPVSEDTDRINVHMEIQNCINVLTPLANMANVQFRINFLYEDIHVIGEKSKLKQCMINTIKNGIEACENSGIIEIQTEIISDQVNIKISDNGKGMTKDQVERLGEPYFSTKTTGTGLGMMVTCSIIKAMKGKIQFHSEVGVGTEVLMSLPTEKK